MDRPIVMPPGDPGGSALAADLAAFHARHPGNGGAAARRWRIALIVEVALLLAVWQVAVGSLGLIREAFFPPPTAIVASLIEITTRASFPGHILFSLANLVVGVLLSIAVGVGVGLAVGWSRLLDLTVAPIIWTIYAIPKVAFAPLMILAFGLGPASKIAMVFLLGVFPIALNTIEGVRTVDPSLIRAARVFGTKGRRIFRTVILPATLPYVLIGIRRAIAIGFIGAMLGEFLGGNKGIGYLLKRAAQDFHMDDSLALVVVMIAVANVGLLLMDRAQHRWAPWSR